MVTENGADVEFCRTVTDTGTAATAEFELESDTTVPPEGAGPLSVTVPVTGWPPVIEAGLTAIVLSVSATGFTVSPVFALPLPYEALSVTGVADVTLRVVTENVANVAPCRTLTEVGTAATVEFELESDTTAPLEGAGPLSVTVPVTG